jgi:hypothetical protein
VLTLPTLSAAAGTLLSLSPLRRRDPRERERAGMAGAAAEDAGMDAVQRRLMFEDE